MLMLNKKLYGNETTHIWELKVHIFLEHLWNQEKDVCNVIPTPQNLKTVFLPYFASSFPKLRHYNQIWTTVCA